MISFCDSNCVLHKGIKSSCIPHAREGHIVDTNCLFCLGNKAIYMKLKISFCDNNFLLHKGIKSNCMPHVREET